MKEISNDHDGSEAMESDENEGSEAMEDSYENSFMDDGENSVDSKKSVSDRNDNSLDKCVDGESNDSHEDLGNELKDGESVDGDAENPEENEIRNELSVESHEEDSQNGYPENEESFVKRSHASSPASNSLRQSPSEDGDIGGDEDDVEHDEIKKKSSDDADENKVVVSEKDESNSSHSSKDKWKLVNGNKEDKESNKNDSESKDDVPEVKDDLISKETGSDENMDVDKGNETEAKPDDDLDDQKDEEKTGDDVKDVAGAPIETRRRSLRTAARKPVVETVTKLNKGEKSPRRGKGSSSIKSDKSPVKDEKNHTSPTKLPKEKPVPKLEPMSEEILEEAKFPQFLRDTITLGCYVPILDKNTNHVKLKEGESLLEAPSLSMPLLLKKPDAINKNVTLKRDKDETIKKGVFQMKPYFSSSVGEFLIGIGLSRVTEWYEKDMIKVKQRQIKRDGQSQEADDALQEHKNFFARAKQANEPFHFEMKKCESCEFKSESQLVMQGHLLIPHITSRREFKCNFCTFITRDHKAVLFHMEALHNRKGTLDLPSQFFYDCPFCTFETNLKTKATSHINKCQRYFLAARNQGPPGDWENPAVTAKPITLSDIKSYEMCVAAASVVARSSASPKNMQQRGVGRPVGSIRSIRPATPQFKPLSSQSNLSLYQQLVTASLKEGNSMASSLMQKHRFPSPKLNTGGKPEITLAVPGGQIYHVVNNGQVVPVINQAASGSQFLLSPAQNTSGPPQPVALFPNLATTSANSRNSISLIPSASAAVKRLPSSTTLMPTIASPANLAKLQQQQQSSNLPKLQGPYTTVQTAAKSSTNPLMGNTTFVICEICDGYLKDLEQLRTHMLWIHKVKIHPKMLSSRPPLNCQKCQWRFFTDQGLERHLLGAHGLVTSNMQELANKNQDGGRCTVCGRVYVCKLVSHMNQVHKATLKPAHLSYKCTVCSATFNLYKLFENHVYMFHSGSVKRSATDDAGSAKKKLQSMELTVVPLKKVDKPAPASVRTSLPPPMKLPAVEPLPIAEPTLPTPVAPIQLKKNFEFAESVEKTRIRISNDNTGDIVRCQDCGRKVRSLYMHMRARHTRKCKVKLCRIEKCEKCLSSFDGMVVLHTADFQGSEDESDELPK